MNRLVKEVMTKRVEVVPPDCNILDAAQKMKELGVGVLPICENDRLRGMITDRDIALRAVASGADVHKTTVEEIMSSPIIYCYEDQQVGDVARIMEVEQIRRLVVLDRNKRMCGIVSLGDIAVKTGREDLAGEILERVSEPSRPQATL